LNVPLSENGPPALTESAVEPREERQLLEIVRVTVGYGQPRDIGADEPDRGDNQLMRGEAG